MNFTLRFLITSLFFILPVAANAQMFEDMEQGSKGGYAPAEITLETGTWMFNDALIGTEANDRKNGTRSARIRNGYIEMRFDYPNGMSEVSFYAANAGFSGDTGGIVQVHYSTDSGNSWDTLGDPFTLTSTLTQYSITESIPGNVRLRFEKTAGNRINVDDILISDYIESSEEPSLLLRVNDTAYENGETFDFGTNTGTASATLLIRNTGQEDLVISDSSIEGEGFSVDGDLNVTLQNMETVTYTLNFESQTSGVKTGSLNLNTNDPENNQYTLNLTAETLDTSQPIPIAEARNLPQGTTVTVSGWITVTNQFAGPIYFQDETGGIGWYNNEIMRENWLVDAIIGDSLVVTGEIGNFNNLLQIVNDSGYEVFPESNMVVDPAVITIADLNTGNYEGQLIQIEDVTFQSSGLFSGGTNYTINDGSATGQLRVDNFTNIGGTSIPNAPAEITGVAGRFMSTHQLLPRFTNDIRVLVGPVITTAAPYEVSASENSITFEWNTESSGHSEMRYGTTSSLELGSVIQEDHTTSHSITINDLQPATTYKVQLRSAAGPDTSATNIHITSTSSPAGTTGEILVYFNKDVATELATYREASGNINFRDELIQKIRDAQESAVFAFYSISGGVGNQIASEIIDAHNRGVDVRVIASGHTGNTNPVITTLSNAGVRAVQSTGSEQQHNKFAIFDADHEDPAKAWVVTSSWNATDQGTFDQYQNMVQIQDVALARAYMHEFNQMWGGSSGNFNPSNARFSADKEVVNPSVFWIGEDQTEVRLFFSPQANTEAQINRTLASAESTIDLGLNLITRRPISNTMLSRFNQGVKVRGVIGQISGQGSEWEYLSGWADVHHFPQSEFGLLHHKYAIVDGEDGNLDSKVITGSHNWSANANFNNDENTLIIYSSRVANEFLQEYAARYWQAGGEDQFDDVTVNIGSDDEELPRQASLSQNYPNPFNPTTNINFELPSSQQVSLRVYDITGRLVATLINNQMMPSGSHTVNFDASRLASGVYIYRMQLNNGQAFTRKMTLIK